MQIPKDLIPKSKKQLLARSIDRLGIWPRKIKAGPARGLTFWAPYFRGRIYSTGDYESHVLAALSDHVKTGMSVCDVGSYLGYYASAFAQMVGQTGHVYAFEPHPRNASRLHRNISWNYLSQITLETKAVGEEEGQVIFQEWINETMSRVKTRGSTPWVLREIDVPMTTLDHWAARNLLTDQIDLIKLDIEGQEMAALKGAVNLLNTSRPVVCCEIHRGTNVSYTAAEIVNWLQRQGYALKLIPSANRVHANLMDAVNHLDVLEPQPGVMHVMHILAIPK